MSEAGTATRINPTGSESLKPQYTKAEPIELKNHPDFDERWLQKLIAQDTTILGLGELDLIERERRQDRGGRLDLLLADPDENQRYEVELMLGSTDESHIIRCLEYWDIERRRYPQYDHCAVLVAEDVTSRFLNVLSLLNGQIPLIAIQLNALKVGNQIVLDFVRVMDRVSLRADDISETTAEPADRDYWVKRSSAAVLKVVDECLKVVNQKANPTQNLNYNKYFIGLNDGIRSRNFVHFRPKKQFLHVLAQIEDKQAWITRFEEHGLPATAEGDRFLKVTIKPSEFEKHEALMAGLLTVAVDEFQK
jgi:hypothetical protein